MLWESQTEELFLGLKKTRSVPPVDRLKKDGTLGTDLEWRGLELVTGSSLNSFLRENFASSGPSRPTNTSGLSSGDLFQCSSTFGFEIYLLCSRLTLSSRWSMVFEASCNKQGYALQFAGEDKTSKD